ncbi:hypothetical protein [Lyngbya confervoides]|uniref:Uncharacterized protein n=1 Tax=Lyngbya confervoides BDU141951 TaxID=1574623 RepID=A0ABD4T1A3_9CYAN|nr:hypothetical protein [Lyngbya confervoides]MCM1982213.1 hypothetical protein [Lyngbya confervoides BDU141951]
MTLVPCRVCGTLNSDQADLCLSCEYPIQGRRRPWIFQGAAVLVLFLFLAPVLGVVLGFFQFEPQRSPSPLKPDQSSSGR